MRRLAPAALVASLVLAPHGFAASSQPARLQLLPTEQLAVRGSHFRARERVTLLVVAGTRRATKTTVAGRAGTFTVTLAGFSSSTCAGFAITATGSKGSRAGVKRPPGQCASP